MKDIKKYELLKDFNKYSYYSAKDSIKIILSLNEMRSIRLKYKKDSFFPYFDNGSIYLLKAIDDFLIKNNKEQNKKLDYFLNLNNLMKLYKDTGNNKIKKYLLTIKQIPIIEYTDELDIERFYNDIFNDSNDIKNMKFNKKKYRLYNRINYDCNIHSYDIYNFHQDRIDYLKWNNLKNFNKYEIIHLNYFECFISFDLKNESYFIYYLGCKCYFKDIRLVDNMIKIIINEKIIKVDDLKIARLLVY